MRMIMQAGYSLSLGEIVPAADAEYDDCSKFQITCPACREAVFKGMRTTPREIHYFSHYKAVDAAALCEFRVAQLAKQAGIVDGIQDHGQTLKKFLSNFRDNIVAGYERASGINLWRPAMKIYVQPYLNDVAEIAFKQIYELVWKESGSRESAEQILSYSPLLEQRSMFWRRRAASYILDALRHLNTEQASTNRRLLIALAFSAWSDRDIVRRKKDSLTTEDGSGRAFMDAVSAARPRKVVENLLEGAWVREDNSDKKPIDVKGLSPQQIRLKKAEADRKRTALVARLAALELLVPAAVLLSLGYDQ